MIKMFRYIAYFLSVLFLLLFIFEKYRNKGLAESIRIIEKKAEINERIFEEQYTIHEINCMLRAKGIENIALVNRKGDELFFWELDIFNKHVLYMDSEMCSLCIQKEFENLETLAEKFGKEIIIVIMSGFRKRYLFNERMFLGWDNLYLTSEELYTCGNICNSPIYSFFESYNDMPVLSCMSGVSNRNFLNYLNVCDELAK